jgi:hypothetical protein
VSESACSQYDPEGWCLKSHCHFYTIGFRSGHRGEGGNKLFESEIKAETATVKCQKTLIFPVTEPMDGPCGQLLAGAGFAINDNRTVQL